jgi:hypothetical protein
MARSSVDLLPNDVKDALVRKLKIGYSTLDQALEWLAEQGFEISRSALGRFSKRYDRLAAKMKRTDEVTRAFVQELGAEPEGDQGRLLARMLETVVFDHLDARLDDEDEDEDKADEGKVAKAQDLMFLARALKDIGAAKKGAIDLTVQIRQQALKDAATAAEKSLKNSGITKETIEQIKASILGVS